MEDIKEQVRKLISAGKTEEALRILKERSNDALLLLARYNNVKKQQLHGMMDFSDWSRQIAQINFAALDLVSSLGDAPSGASSPPQTPKPLRSSKKVFISYSWKDKDAARKVKQYLEKRGHTVIIDEEGLKAGELIIQFIQNGIKQSDAVVSIVSSKSLKSGWVGGESIAAMYAVWLADKKFIPLKLDDEAFNIDFQIEAQEYLQAEIKTLKAKIKKLESLGGDSSAFRDDLNRMVDLKNNLGKIVQRFKNVLTLDITDGNFDKSMEKVSDEL
jgi:hypothetical protein